MARVNNTENIIDSQRPVGLNLPLGAEFHESTFIKWSIFTVHVECGTLPDKHG